MENEIYFENPSTKVIITDKYISINRGNHNLWIHKALRGETRIFYDQIIEVKFKEPSGLGKGYIQFCTARTSMLGSLRTADQPQNAIKFNRSRLDDAKALRDFVYSKITNDETNDGVTPVSFNDSLEQHKKRERKGCLNKVLAFFAVVLALFIILVVAALNSDSSETTVSEPQTYNDEVANESREKSEITDNIIRQAREDASQITDEQTKEAVNFIYEHYNHYFENDEIMEKCIYYGSLLQYAYEDDYKTDLTAKTYTDLGSDTVRLVKYVYRGTESSTEKRMSINLEQIKEDLIYLGYEF